MNHVKNITAEGREQVVHIAIVAPGFQPYLDYNEWTDIPKDSVVPQALFVVRWDGMFGFAGGFVDQGEDLNDAVMREVFEEVGVDITEYRNTVQILDIEITEKREYYFMTVEVSNDTYKEILINSRKNAVHSFAEISGYCSMFLIDSFMNNLLEGRWSGNGKKQVIKLYEKYHYNG